MVEDMICHWLDNFGNDMEVQFVRAIRRYADVLHSKTCSRWSLFAGSGLATRFYTSVQNVWKGLYGIEVVFAGAFYAEKDPKKQTHLCQQFQPSFLVADAGGLSGHVAPNLQDDGVQKLLPVCFQLDAGFPCTSRTPQSSARSRNLNCVQQERSATGQGWT